MPRNGTAIAGLGRRLEATIAPEAILPTIAQAVQQSLQLPYVAIALEQEGVSDVAAATGTPLEEPLSFPLSRSSGAESSRAYFNPACGSDRLYGPR